MKEDTKKISDIEINLDSFFENYSNQIDIVLDNCCDRLQYVVCRYKLHILINSNDINSILYYKSIKKQINKYTSIIDIITYDTTTMDDTNRQEILSFIQPKDDSVVGVIITSNIPIIKNNMVVINKSIYEYIAIDKDIDRSHPIWIEKATYKNIDIYDCLNAVSFLIYDMMSLIIDACNITDDRNINVLLYGYGHNVNKRLFHALLLNDNFNPYVIDKNFRGDELKEIFIKNADIVVSATGVENVIKDNYGNKFIGISPTIIHKDGVYYNDFDESLNDKIITHKKDNMLGILTVKTLLFFILNKILREVE